MDEAKRLLFNLRSRCREKGLVEGKLWRKLDVQRLLDAVELPESVLKGVAMGLERPKFRLVRIDDEKPWLPDNCKVVM